MAMMIHDVQDDDQVEELLDVLIESKHICFDLETMSDRFKANGERKPNEDWHPHSRVVSASFTVRDNESWVVPLSHPAGPWSTDGWWRPVLQRLADMMTGAKLIGHNLPYDIRWVYSMTGVDLLSNMWGDTMFAQHLLDENAPKGLKPMAEDRLGVPPWADVDLGRSEEEPWEAVRNYNALDTRHNWHLWWEAIYPELRKSYSLARLYGKLLVPAGRALSRMSRVGMNLDVSGLEVREWALTQSIDRRQWDLWNTYVPEALREQYGDRTVRVKAGGEGVEVHCDYMPTWSAQGKFFGELMEALDVPVLERTEKTGKASWNEGVMKRITLEGDFPFVEDVLAMRHETKELTSFITPWLAMKSPEGKLHPTFKPAHVTTGRLSAADPNPQQIPSKLKAYAAKAPPGWLVVQVDYAQIELRIVADLADEQNMLHAFQRGDDLHAHTACGIARDQAAQYTKLLLVRAGLPADRAGAEVLRALWDSAPEGVEPEAFLRARRQVGADQEARGRQRGGSVGGEQSLLEGWGISAASSSLPEGFMRAVRQYEVLSRSSQGPQPGKQPPLELRDLVSLLPRLSPSTLESLRPGWKGLRQRAKACGFGFLYGMGAERFLDYAFEEYAELFTYPEAVEVRDLFFDTWPGLLSFYDRQEREALTSGEVRTPLGRRRRLPEIRSRNRVKQSMARRQAINAPVQSYASDLMLLSIVQLDHQLDPANARLFCTVHDSLVAYVRSGTMRDFVDTVSAVMLRPEVEAFGARPLRVPLAVEFEVGKAWGAPEHIVTRTSA